MANGRSRLMHLDSLKIWPTVVALLILTLVGFELTDWDLWVQDFFYRKDTQDWLIPRREFWSRAVFYTGPKVLIIAGGVTLIILLVGPARWRNRWQVNRRQLGVVVLTLAIVPSFVGQLKDITGVYCPWDIRRYGGDVPYIRVFENHPPHDRPLYAGRGFPAGHASGGFALVALMTLARTKRQKGAALAVAFFMGWVMGTYQIAKGAHYVSHTFVTMWLAWLIYRGINALFGSPSWQGSPEL